MTPDDVKCRLLASARPAVTSAGTLAYSVFQQGAGLINAVSAVNSSATGCANRGLNIAADLAGTQHFGGPANEDANGNYYIMNMAGSTWGALEAADGYSWSSAYNGTQGYTWSEGYTWSQAYPWNQAYTWTSGYAWGKGYAWAAGYPGANRRPWWGTNSSSAGAPTPASIENWVPNQ